MNTIWLDLATSTEPMNWPVFSAIFRYSSAFWEKSAPRDTAL